MIAIFCQFVSRKRRNGCQWWAISKHIIVAVTYQCRCRKSRGGCQWWAMRKHITIAILYQIFSRKIRGSPQFLITIKQITELNVFCTCIGIILIVNERADVTGAIYWRVIDIEANCWISTGNIKCGTMDAFAAEPELAKTASKRDVFYAFRPKSCPFAAADRVFEILIFS